MSRWTDSFENNSFIGTWTSLKADLEGSDLTKGLDVAQGFEVARARKVISFVDTVLEQVDPELLPVSFFGTLGTHASNMSSELAAFKGNRNTGHLHNMNSHADSAILAVSQSPFLLTGLQKGGLTRAATSYSETVETLVANLALDVEQKISQVEQKSAGVDSGLASSAESIKTLEAQIRSNSDDVQKQLAQYNTQFQTSEASRTERFDGIAGKLADRADAEFSSLATKAGKILGVLSKFQDDAQDVLGVVVNTAQAGAYASYANEEKKSANGFRVGAVSLMLIGVAVLVIPELMKIAAEQALYELDWRRVIGRIPFSLILFVPAFYLAKESSRHRNNEVLNRRRQLILTTIHPYLALLETDRAQQIKAEVAKGIFSEGTALTDAPDPDTASNVIAQISNLVKLLAKNR